LLEGLAKSGKVKLRGLEAVPHDLWAAADLPSLPLIERLTLLLAQFDLTFAYEDKGRTILLVDLPEDVAITRSYPGGAKPAELAEKWGELLPGSQVEVDGRMVRVTGRLEDHERIAVTGSKTGGRGSTRTKVTGEAQTLYTLTVREKPLGPLLAELGKLLKLDMRYDRDKLQQAGISLDDRVSFSVKDVSLDELLQAALTPAGLEYSREASTVKIEPAGK
jgi:hypothetical protein